MRLDSYSHPDDFGNTRFDVYPVIYVTWNDADTFRRWDARRLPTEAEWERAARVSDERIYPPDSAFGNLGFRCAVSTSGHPTFMMRAGNFTRR